jgi:hypothetical protein
MCGKGIVLSVTDTLAVRGTRYGTFAGQARITQAIKRAMADSPNWATLPDDAVNALDMIASKIARILNGDPNYDDSWHDIGGYAKLIEDRIHAETARRSAPEQS